MFSEVCDFRPLKGRCCVNERPKGIKNVWFLDEDVVLCEQSLSQGYPDNMIALYFPFKDLIL